MKGNPMSIYEFERKRPKVGETSFVHPAAVLIGGVTIGENCYIGPGAVLRGDFGTIEIGDGSNVQENCVIHSFPEQTARLGRDSHIGHCAIIHGATIRENVLVGMGAILHDGVEIGQGCIIGSGCVITANQIIPAGKLVVGVPGRVIGDVSSELKQAKLHGTKIYQALPRRYKEAFQLIG
jgi:carbonic anhydrase/acetyltransferase-like protein (isoleucine patch superfamily)